MTTQTKDQKKNEKPEEKTPEKAAPKAKKQTKKQATNTFMLGILRVDPDGTRHIDEVKVPDHEMKNAMSPKAGVKAAIRAGKSVETYQNRELRSVSFGPAFVFKAVVEERVIRKVKIDESDHVDPPAGTA